MLAYTPLHALLFGLSGDEPGPPVLVMTSGNLGGEPICFTDDDALQRLSHLADGWLMHDRAILVPCDDSVVRVVDAVELPIRRSRGYAPLPVALPVPVPPTLAVGADLKNTCAVADQKYAWLSQHIGDMDDLATLVRLRLGRAAARVADRRCPGNRCRGLASGLSVHRVGASQRLRTAGAIGPAPSRTHRRSDGRTRARRIAARCSASRSTEPATAPTARSGVARCWSPTTRASATGAAEVRSVGRRRRQRAAPVPDGAVTPVGGRTRLGRRPGAGACLSRRRAMSTCCTSSTPASDAHRHPAWAGSSTRFQRWRASGRWSHTRPGGHRAGGHVPRLRLRSTTYSFAIDTVRALRSSTRRPVLAAVVGDVRAGVPAGVVAARFHRAVADLVVDLAARDRDRKATPSRCRAACSRTRCCCGWSVRLLRERDVRGDHASAGAAERRWHRIGSIVGAGIPSEEEEAHMCLAVPGRIIASRTGTGR